MSPAQKHRYHAALDLLGEGWTAQEVATQLGLPLSTLYRWRAATRPPTSRFRDALQEATPAVIRSLISLALSGDLRAIREFLRLL